MSLAEAMAHVTGKAGYEERQEAIELAVKHADRLGWRHSAADLRADFGDVHSEEN